jgi:hypothetical protein
VQVDFKEAQDNEIVLEMMQQDKASKSKSTNILRTQDHAATLGELQSLRSKYPSLADLQNKEKELLEKDISALLMERKWSYCGA